MRRACGGRIRDRKDGKATAYVGKQYLRGIGKIDNGVVSVSSLWVDERVYCPLAVEPGATHESLLFEKHDARVTSAAISEVVDAVRNDQPLAR
jgi:hypothetical protein